MKVLLVDDDYELVQRKFNNVSAEFIFAENGEQAIQILAQNSVDIILMDGNLREEYGHEVVAKIREEGIVAKIVMFSSEDKQNDLGIKAGANAVLNKKDFYKYIESGKLNEKLLDLFRRILE